MQIIYFLNRLSSNKGAWILLLCASIAFQICAVYFQHVMGLKPCVMCIYERVAMVGVVLSALFGLIVHRLFITRIIALSAWLITSAWGTLLSYEHVDYQLNPSPWNMCDIFVNFPKWAPLNKWLPAFFEANGDCADIVWQFWGLSMPQWLTIIFFCMAIICTFVLISAFFPQKRVLTDSE